MRPRLAVLGLVISVGLSDCQDRAEPGSQGGDGPVETLPTFARGGATEATIVTPTRPPGAPFGLTASDGSGIKLVSIAARAVVQDPLAFTELHLVFENLEDRVREGTFSITLPARASISRFAMKVGPAWQEGEVVERQAARRVYEDFLHRKQDPALLEHGAGNQFSARVFPIPAWGSKELILSYSEDLKVGAPYVLPLAGLPAVDRIAVEATIGDWGAKATYNKDGEAPAGDFTIERKRLSGSDGLRSDRLAVMRVRPVAVATAEPPTSTIVLVDTSASRALGFEAQLELVASVVRRIATESGRDTPVTVAAFDQGVEPMYRGAAGGFDGSFVAKALARGALGASDLAHALAWAGKHAREARLHRVVVVSDGVSTVGPTKGDELVATARALSESGVTRLDVVSVGGIRDEAALKRVVMAGLPSPGVVIDAAEGADAVVRRLSQSSASDLQVRVVGARWWWPERVEGAQPGDEVLVYAEVPGGGPVRVTMGNGQPFVPRLLQTDETLLSRAVARARIEALEDQAAKEPGDPSLMEAIVDLSLTHRVLSKHTALLVLETEADYARFRIDRSALADILTVKDGAVAVVDRRPKRDRGAKSPFDDLNRARDGGSDDASAPDGGQPGPAAAPAPAGDTLLPGGRWTDNVGESFGAGGLGLSGMGEGGGVRDEGIGLGNLGGFGRGAGTGRGQGFVHDQTGGSHRARPPSIREGAVMVSGRLLPEVIQRIVRQNWGRFRACYEGVLRTNPSRQGLEGRVSVAFIIDRKGAVSRVADAGSNLPDTGMVQCVKRVFAGLSFPQPESGHVAVVYPIIFALGEPMPKTKPIPKTKPYTGRFETVMKLIEDKQAASALKEATAWRAAEPGDVLALIALGEAYEASGDAINAARAYGSIIDLFPSRADLRRFAGGRLERVKAPSALDLAVDTYRRAVEQRPDHPASHRMLAMALLKKGAFAEAFDAIVEGHQRTYPTGRFAGVPRILAEDVGLVAAAWIRAKPTRRDEIVARVNAVNGVMEDGPSLRFVVTWETDANDLDFHVHDASGGHAYYAQMDLPNGGGSLYADVTTGYGPECFTVRLPKEKRSESYRMEAHYYSRGPMGYGMGRLSILDHDGKGNLTFDERPFVVMVDGAYVDLGTLKK